LHIVIPDIQTETRTLLFVCHERIWGHLIRAIQLNLLAAACTSNGQTVRRRPLLMIQIISFIIMLTLPVIKPWFYHEQ